MAHGAHHGGDCTQLGSLDRCIPHFLSCSDRTFVCDQVCLSLEPCGFVDSAGSSIRISFGCTYLGLCEITVKTIHILGIGAPAFIHLIVIFFDVPGTPSGAFDNRLSLIPPSGEIAAMLEGKTYEGSIP